MGEDRRKGMAKERKEKRVREGERLRRLEIEKILGKIKSRREV